MPQNDIQMPGAIDGLRLAAAARERSLKAIGGDGKAVFAAAEALGVEGIVSKRASGRHTSGCSREWIKAKCMVEVNSCDEGIYLCPVCDQSVDKRDLLDMIHHEAEVHPVPGRCNH